MKYQYQPVEESHITNFKELVKSLPYILDSMKLNHNQVFRAIEMSRSTWERRLKTNSFTADEMLRIAKFVNLIYASDKRKKKGK